MNADTSSSHLAKILIETFNVKAAGSLKVVASMDALTEPLNVMGWRNPKAILKAHADGIVIAENGQGEPQGLAIVIRDGDTRQVIALDLTNTQPIPQWSSRSPREQGEWWHWTGNPMDAPFFYYVMASGHGDDQSFFVTHESEPIESPHRVRNVDNMPGFWCPVPPPPRTDSAMEVR